MAVTLCPLALTAGCRRCPIFNVCPLKGVIGDQRPAAPGASEAEPAKPGGRQRKTRRG